MDGAWPALRIRDPLLCNSFVRSFDIVNVKIRSILIFYILVYIIYHSNKERIWLKYMPRAIGSALFQIKNVHAFPHRNAYFWWKNFLYQFLRVRWSVDLPTSDQNCSTKEHMLMSGDLISHLNRLHTIKKYREF